MGRLIKKILRDHYILLVILVLATIIRLATTSRLMAFTADEEYQAYFAQTIIKHFHIIWIGMSAGGFDLYLGPFLIYIISPFLALMHGDPVILGYLGSIIGILSIPLLYYLGLQIFNKRAAIIGSLFYSTLPLIVFYDQKPYPTAIPILSILMALSLYKTRSSKYWWIIFAATYGMVFHIHLSLILVGVLGFYWLLTHKKTIDRKTLFLSILVFLIMVSPLIGFDYFHKASNITTPIRVVKSLLRGGYKPNINYHLDNLYNSLGRVWYIGNFKESSDEILYPCSYTPSSTFSKALPTTSLVTIAILIYFAYLTFRVKRFNSEVGKLLLFQSLCFLAPFLILPIINPIEYYLLGFFPLLFVITGAVIETLPKKMKSFTYILVILVSLLGIFSILSAKGDFGLDVKRKLIFDVKNKIGNSSYELKEAGDCHKFEGWRYLFSVYFHTPTKSSVDNMFGWLYQNELSNKNGRYLVIVKENRSVETIKKGYKFNFSEGGFSAFIY